MPRPTQRRRRADTASACAAGPFPSLCMMRTILIRECPGSMSREIHALYVDHHRWLLAWLSRRLRDAPCAADLAHDTFVRLLKRPQPPDAAVREPRAWLQTIAHGLMVDHLRRQALEAAYLRELAALPEAEQPSPELRLQLLQALVQIDAALDGLAPKARSAFLMSRLEGLSHVEIAARLGVHVSSVEKYVAAALRRCFLLRAAG